MPEAFCGLEMCAKSSVNSVRSVREKTIQQLSSILSHMEGAFYFSQKNTEEQNTQRPTETLSQPISQNLTATFSYNVLWYLYAEGVLWDQNCAQQGSVRSVSSVRERNILRERRNSPASLIGLISYRGCVLFLTENTEEQNTQGSTETLSQPISQNLTATFSWNVLWILYAGGLLWVRNVRQKRSVKSVSSVRERNVLCERKNYPASLIGLISSRGCVLFLTEKHRWTEHTAFHRDIKSTDFTEPYSHL